METKKTQTEKTPSLIFIDFDILNTEKAQKKKNEESIDYVRKIYLERRNLRKDFNEPEMFAKLTDDEILTMHSWDNYRIDQISELKRFIDKAHFVFMTTTNLDREHFDYMCRLSSLSGSDLLVYESEKTLPDRINEYMAEKTEYKDFAVVSRIDLRFSFPDRAIWIRTEKIDFDAISSRLYRYLGCEPMDYFTWHTDMARGEDIRILPFYKVIFLDIDGVLNDEGEEYYKGVKIDLNMVKRLGKIVEATDADIVLSSSWKRAYKRFVDNGFKAGEREEALYTLYNLLKDMGITIRGTTPITNASGHEARPFEIRRWLMKYHRIFSYVILEDDTFWDWGFLQRNVVSTITIDPSRGRDREKVRGLTDAHVEKAIAILNERSASPYRYWED